MSFLEKLGFGKKPETPQVQETQEATPVAAEVTPAVVPEVAPTVEPEATSPAPAAADLGAQADKLATIIDGEVAATGSLDAPAPTTVPEAATIAEQVAVLDDTSAAEATFTVPEISEPAPVTSPVATEGIVAEVPTPATEITVDPIQDATADPDSNKIWQQFDGATPAESTAPIETQQ